MCPFPLEVCGEHRIVHANMRKFDEYLFGIPAVNRQHVIHFAVTGESEQCLLGHRVDGVRGGEGLDVKDVRSLGVFRSGAGQQEALRLRPGSGKFLPPGRDKQIPIGFVGPFGDGNTETVPKLPRTFPITALSQRLMKSDATEPTFVPRPASIRRSIPRMYATAAAMYCSRENRSVTLTGTPAKTVSSMAGSPSRVPGILMKRLGRFALA